MLAGGGSGDGRLFWIGGAAVLVIAVAAIVRLPTVAPEGLALIGLLAALAVWQAASIHWSIEPARSWDYANRTLVYFAFACVGLFLGGLPRRWIATALGMVFAVALVVAFAGKVFAGIEPDYQRLARLRWPLAYWNELALVAALTVPLGLWLAGRRDRPLRSRVAGALHVYGGLVAVVLTFSRFGIALAIVGGLVWTWLERDRHESLGALVAAVPPAGIVAGISVLLPGIADNAVSHHARVRDGAIFAALLVAGAIVTALVGWFALAREPDAPARRRAVRAGGAALAGVVVAALIVLVVRAGGPGEFVHVRWNEFTTSQTPNTLGRFGTASSGNRWLWWQQSWHAFTHHPGGGTGAGTFGLTSTVAAHNSIQSTVEPHNTPLQFLTETGVVGFLLYAGIVATVLVAFLRGPRDRATQALGLVLAIAWIHSLVDIDWSYIATQAPLFAVAGLLTARPRERTVPARGQLLPRAAVAVCTLAALYSLFAPWYSRHLVDQALGQLEHADIGGALGTLDDAHRMNPLAIEPLLLSGALGNDVRPLLQATRREPRNPEPWYELASFYARAKQWCAADAAASRSYHLDPYGPAGQRGPSNVGNVARKRCHH